MSGFLLEWLKLMCRELLPWQQRAANLAMLVSSVGECMATRYTAPSVGLWRTGASAFNAIVAAGLPAVNIACVNEEQPPGPEVWDALAIAFEGCGPIPCPANPCALQPLMQILLAVTLTSVPGSLHGS